MSQITDAQLLEWLDNDPERLERHLRKHPADEARLDRATQLTEAQLTEMSAAVAPPVDMTDRLRIRLVTDPSTSAALSTMAGLFSLPWETTKLISSGQKPVEGDGSIDPTSGTDTDGTGNNGTGGDRGQ
ncbi:MAG: hypothetical protein AB7V43_09075 [Acidimicrobiia bacterium]